MDKTSPVRYVNDKAKTHQDHKGPAWCCLSASE